MRQRIDPPDALISLADAQAGILTTAQLTRLGMPRRARERLVRQGVWRDLGRGLVQANNAPPSWEARAWMGVLVGGERAMLAGHAAGHRQGLVSEPPQVIHVVVPTGRGVVERPGYRFERRGRLPRPRGSLPCTPPEVTVLDLCALQPDRSVQWVTSALRERISSPRMLRQELDARGRLPVPVRELVGDMLADAQGLESPLEELYLRRVERAHGLPAGVRQLRRRTGRHDIAYPWGLLVELDGRIHDSTSQVFRDLHRDNEASLDGWWTHRYGYQDCHLRACETALQVARKLRQLGWEGLPHSCPNCRDVPDWGRF